MYPFLKSSTLAIAAGAIFLLLAVFVVPLARPASANVSQQAPPSEPRADNDDFTVSTTEELISSETWRSPYALPGGLAVLIGTYVYAYRRLNQRRDRS